MAARYFCDVCSAEMEHKDHDRIVKKLAGLSVEILTAWKNTWNAGHLCHRCIIKTVNEGITISKDELPPVNA